MARRVRLVLALILAIAAPLAFGRAAPGGAAGGHASAVNSTTLIGWGVSARVITGKIPTLNIVLTEDQVLAAWPQARAAGLVKRGDADWARTHPLVACRDVAFAATPTLLRDLYDQDDALDFAPVYVLLRAGSRGETRPLFSMNVNRAIVRKLRDGRDVAARAVLSPWLQEQLARKES